MARNLQQMAESILSEFDVPSSHWCVKGKVVIVLVGRGARTRKVTKTIDPKIDDTVARAQLRDLGRLHQREREMEPA